MEVMLLLLLGIVILLFVWGWIGLVMLHSLSIERRMEKLLNITNPLPEEEKELKQLRELRYVESGKVASAKWTLFFFMLAIIGAMAGLASSPTLRALLGLGTALQAIWIGVVALAFICMPTFLGLVLASSSSKLDRELAKLSQKEQAEKGAA